MALLSFGLLVSQPRALLSAPATCQPDPSISSELASLVTTAPIVVNGTVEAIEEDYTWRSHLTRVERSADDFPHRLRHRHKAVCRRSL